METETYFETVPDGFDTEQYTEQVPCGQDCTTTPETCTEHCTSDDNGFATCSQSCSGGGQSCTPRTCTETRTRQVPRTRQEARTREVRRYRAEPRTAEWGLDGENWLSDKVINTTWNDFCVPDRIGFAIDGYGFAANTTLGALCKVMSWDET